MPTFHNDNRKYETHGDTVQFFTNRVKVKFKKDGRPNYNWVPVFAPFQHSCKEVLEAWGKAWVERGWVTPVQGQFRAPVKVVVPPTRWQRIAAMVMEGRV